MNRWPAYLAAIAFAGLLAACAPTRYASPASQDEAASAPRSSSAAPASEASPSSKPEHALPTAAPNRAAEAVPDAIDSPELLSELRQLLRTPTCLAAPEVQSARQLYARSPQRFAAQLGAVLPLLAYVVDEVRRRELPGEFALIPLVESWYRPDAIGPGGAVGMWQLVAGTARGEGMLIRGGYDGRLSALRSTQVALNHLADLHSRFGDWRLAAMAYNAGEYRIAALVKRHRPQLRADGRLTLPGAPVGSDRYIAKLEALACLVAKASGESWLPPRPVARLTTLEVPPGLHRLDTVAAALDVDPEQLARLNASYRHRAFLDGAPRQLLVPASSRSRWPALAGLADLPPSAPKALETSHVVRVGDSLWSIARRHRLHLKDLMEWNRLHERSVLRPGQVLRLAP